MPIRVQCSSCKTTLAVKDHLAGKRVKCPKCQSPLSVPTAKFPVAPKASQAEVEAMAAAALGDEPAAAAAANGANGANGHAPVGDAPIKFTCEYCEAEIELPYENAGKKAPCPECRHIIKVPMPKVEKTKDWRTIEKKGPSLAAMNQPEKIENAWGTEKKSKVSQSALLEAGVIEKPKKPSIGLAGWIERGVKAAAIAAVVGGVGWGIWSLRAQATAIKTIASLETACNPKWPAPIQSEFHVMMADLALKQPKQRETARDHYRQAFQILTATDERDKVDRDASLIQIAKAQIKLGGNDYDIRGQDRYDWNQEVFEEIDRTVKMIDSPEARISAVRELDFLFAEIKKPELGVSLANSVSATTPQVNSVRLAIRYANPQKPVAEPGKGSLDFASRCGYAEGIVRKDKGRFAEAKELATRAGETSHKVQALMAIASWLALESNSQNNGDIRTACDLASKYLADNPKANVPGWVLVQHVRLSARHGDIEDAKALAQKAPAAFRRRAKLELAMAALEKDPQGANAQAIIGDLDKDGPNRALAWLALARAKGRANLAFNFAPEDSEEESLRPFFQAVAVCPAPAK